MKLMKLGNKKGFTLLEVLIVLVILAVLAGLAIPAYSAAVEKSRSQEALQSLTAMRDSMMRFFAQNGTYVGATLVTLDYNPNTVTGGQTLIFNYVIGGLGANTFTLTANRQGGPVGSVSLNQAGVVTKTGVYL